MLGVMGSLGLGGGSDLACERFTPSSTYSSRGIVLSMNGSPRPCWIWANLRPERYDLIVLCFNAWLPRYETYLHSMSSWSGNGWGRPASSQNVE